MRPGVLSSRGAIVLPSAPSIARSVSHAALLGIEGDEIVQGLIDMMYVKAPYTVIQRAMHIHPTVYEMIPYIFEDLQPLD